MYHAHLACVGSYVDDGKIRNRTFGSCRRNYERLIAPPVGRKKKNYPKDFDNCVHDEPNSQSMGPCQSSLHVSII